MMSLEAFELRDHHLAGWDQRVPFLVREGARHEDLGKARIGSSFLGRIVRSNEDQVVNHLAGALDAIGGDSAAMSVAQQETACLRKPGRIGGLGGADAKTRSTAVVTTRVRRMESSNPVRPPTLNTCAVNSCRQQSSAYADLRIFQRVIFWTFMVAW